MKRNRDKKGKFLRELPKFTPCKMCGLNIKYYLTITNKFCSSKCYLEYRKAHPELYPAVLMSDEKKEKWIEKMNKLRLTKTFKHKHSIATKKAMQRIDVQKKIHGKRLPWTDKRKAHQSDILVGKRPKNLNYFMNSFLNKSHHGWIDFGEGKKFYMRSIWERNVARYFELLKKNKEIKEWEYEPQRFFFEGISFGNRTYLPDFRITENKGYQYYVEVKGHMDKDSRIKLKRMRKYYPNIEVQLLDKERYGVISKAAPIIKNWEWEQYSKRVKYYVKKGRM